MGQLDRLTQQPDVMGGKACIRGMRVTVGIVVGQIAAGHSIEEVLADACIDDRKLMYSGLVVCRMGRAKRNPSIVIVLMMGFG